ncbi:MAG TPA: carboxypeptidase-like regulatory domain-containing protein, partial [Anaerolineales bacterium]|nr:carboxypeptidase-like regulatory domain-containing protein [Anaerolineales bacterium]
MKRKFTSILLIASTSLILNLFVACGPAVLPATETPTALPTFTASPVVIRTDTPVCEGLCPSDSMTATAAMKATLDAIPSNTPPAGVTITPSVGDLGWGAVYGKIIDGTTGLPIEGATVTCEHFSYTSNYLCHGVTTTNSDGIYSFVPIFFHDTDTITLLVEAPGYAPLHFKQNSFTRPEFHADL